MKKLILSLFVMLLSLQVSAQFGGYDPVSMEETFIVKGSEGTIEFDALIENGYHLYSTDIPAGGPTATTVKFHVVEGAEIVGPLVAGEGAVEKYDDLFEMVVSYFDNEALFTQKVKLLGGAYRIEGTVNYQSCGSGACYMGRYDFELTGTANIAPQEVKEEKSTERKAEQPVEDKKTTVAKEPAKKADTVVKDEKKPAEKTIVEKVESVVLTKAEPVDTVIEEEQAETVNAEETENQGLVSPVV